MSTFQWRQDESGYSIYGELTRHTVPKLWEVIQNWKPEQTEIEVSLKKTEKIDSAGMVMLVHLIQHAKNSNCHIMLSFVPEQLKTLFQLSNIETILVNHIKNR